MNSEKTDYVDLPRTVLLRLDEVVFESAHAEKLFKFFKSRMLAVHDASIHVRLLLADVGNHTIRPIRDEKDSYPKFFVEFLRFVFVVADGNFSLAGDFRSLLQPIVARLKDALDTATELVFADVEEVWRTLVEQKMSVGWDVDLVHMFIRTQCIDKRTGQLVRASAVEQMSAKAFYFCRLFQLNRMHYSTDANRDENTQRVEAYFSTKDTPLNRLCYLKGLANRVIASESVSPIITCGPDPARFFVGEFEMSPMYLQRMFAVLSRSFSGLLEKLLLDIPFDYGRFEVVDDHSNRSKGVKMRCSDPETRKLLIQHLNKVGSNINRLFKLDSGDFDMKAVKQYLALHDESCRVLCPLIHLCSGMPARATEMSGLQISNGSSERNVYFAGSHVMITTRYNKIITRFLPVQLSRQVAAWIIVVRHLYYKLAMERYEGIDQDALDFVFIKKGKCFSSDDVIGSFT